MAHLTVSLNLILTAHLRNPMDPELSSTTVVEKC